MITVAAGEERTDLRIGLRPVPAVTISGRLVTPDGTRAACRHRLRLVGEAAAEVGEEGFETVTGISDASGRFTLLGVPAGEYMLRQATVLSLERLAGPARLVDRPAHAPWVQPTFADLVVQARPALRVEGRLEFRGAMTPPPPAPP